MLQRKWFLLSSFVLIGFLNNSHAMDPAGKENIEERIIVDKPSRPSWSSDYQQKVDVVKGFDLSILRAEQDSNQYLEKNTSSLEHLLYLSTIQKDNTKTPFTQEQQARFTNAKKVKNGVVQFFYINGSIILLTMLFPYTNFMSALQCTNANQTNCLSQTSVIASSASVSVFGAFVLGFISLYATGINPNNSAKKANKVQDEINDLNRNYSTLAKYLIDIHFECPDQAKYIAENFDIEELKKRTREKTYKSGASFIISPLDEACYYIKDEKVLPQFTQIENYVLNKISSQRLAHLEKKLSLNKTEKINKKKYEKK